MNTLLLLIIGIPIIEIYLFIKIGSQIGAFNTISLIFLTAIVGVAYAKHEGFNTLKSGVSGLMKNEIPIYEIISGATLAFAAILLILPGFATDILGILLVFPLTRKLLIIPGFATDILGLLIIFPPTRRIFLSKIPTQKAKETKQDFINGEFEDIDEDNDRKI